MVFIKHIFVNKQIKKSPILSIGDFFIRFYNIKLVIMRRAYLFGRSQ